MQIMIYEHKACLWNNAMMETSSTPFHSEAFVYYPIWSI